MLGNYLQQTTSADNIFRCFFSWRFKGLLQLNHDLLFYILRDHILYIQNIAFLSLKIDLGLVISAGPIGML